MKTLHPCVLFNAWENDFFGDPLLSVLSAIDEQLTAQLSVTDRNDKQAKEVIRRTGKIVKGVIADLIQCAGTIVDGRFIPKELINLRERNIQDSGELVKNVANK